MSTKASHRKGRNETPLTTKPQLSFSNGSPSVELPVYQGSIGPDVIDIRKLYAQTGMFTTTLGFPVHRVSRQWLSPTSTATG